MPPKGYEGRLLWADVMRVAAIFAVVVIHTSSFVVFDIGKVSPGWFWTADIYNSASRVGVNLFVMLSGALLLGGKDEPFGVFFGKRIRKVLVPLMFWGPALFVLNSHIQEKDITVPDVAKEFFTGPMDSHLWFLYMILGLYLLTPALRVFLRGAGDKTTAYFVLLCLVSGSVYPAMKKFVGFQPGVDLPAGGYLGVYMLGYLLARVEYTGRVRKACYAVFAAGVAATALGSYYLNLGNTGSFDLYFYKNLSPNVVLMAAACFVILKNWDAAPVLDRIPNSYSYLKSLSGAALGVYIVHVNVLHAIKDGVGLDSSTWHPLIAVPAAALAGYLVSLMIIIPMRRVPVVKHLVP